jgi:DNA polymerase alpha subunit B
VKEFTVAFSTPDVLMHLSKAEISSGQQTGNRMERLANHLLLQRSYYPLYPPAPGMNVSYEHIDQMAMPCTPDILICPSKLRTFAKKLHNGLVINPGQLSKSNEGNFAQKAPPCFVLFTWPIYSLGGSYARVAVYAPRMADLPVRH